MASLRLSALVAGGGIGGLASAIALAQRGIDVQVCERREEFPEEGAGIQIGPNGTRILEELGVAPYLDGKVSVPEALVVHDGATGRELARLPLGSFIAERHSGCYWTAHRHDLHAALRGRAEREPHIRLTRATEIVSFVNTADGISAKSMSGETFDASLLVAADGLWSRLRDAVSGRAARVEPVGKTAFRSVADARMFPADLSANAVHIWLSPGAHAVHYPVNDGRDVALVVIGDTETSAEGWDAPATAEAVKATVKTFAPSLRTLVESAPHWRQWSLYRLPPLPRWSSGRSVLLGDAAHPMLPFLAQGAVMALEDAVTLAADVDASNGDIGQALRNYETVRRARVSRVVDTSSRNGRIYHMRGVEAFARNVVMKLRDPKSIMTGFDWLYGWRLPSS